MINLTFDEVVDLLYAPRDSGNWGRGDLYEDRIERLKQIVDINEHIFTYIKNPFGDRNEPKLFLFNHVHIIKVEFIDEKIQITIFYKKDIERIFVDDDARDNITLEIIFSDSRSLKFTSNDCNEHYIRRYYKEITNLLKVLQGQENG